MTAFHNAAYLVGTGYVDASGNWQLASASTPLPVTIDAVVGNVTRYTGQAKIAVTGTAVQLTSTSYIMQNGMLITAGPNNTTPVTTAAGVGSTTGSSSVTNLTDGTGNGNLIQPGATQSVGSGVNTNLIYVNGTAGDIFFYDAS